MTTLLYFPRLCSSPIPVSLAVSVEHLRLWSFGAREEPHLAAPACRHLRGRWQRNPSLLDTHIFVCALFVFRLSASRLQRHGTSGRWVHNNIGRFFVVLFVCGTVVCVLMFPSCRGVKGFCCRYLQGVSTSVTGHSSTRYCIFRKVRHVFLSRNNHPSSGDQRTFAPLLYLVVLFRRARARAGVRACVRICS